MKSPSDSNAFMLFFMIYSVFMIFFFGIIGVFVPADIFTLAIFVLQHIFLFGVPILIFAFVKKIPLKRIAPFKPIDFKTALLTIGIAVLTMPIMSFIAAVTTLFAENEVSDAVYKYMEIYPFWVIFLGTAIMPAVFEELTFRGMILNGYKRMPAGVAIAMTALLFGIMHMDAYQFFYATAAGIMFTALVYYSGSIYTSMLAHLVINGSQIILAKMSIMAMDEWGEEAVEMEMALSDKLAAIMFNVFAVVVTLPFLVALIVLFIKHNKGKNHDYIYDLGDDEFVVDIYKNTKIIDLPVVLTVVIFLAYILAENFMGA